MTPRCQATITFPAAYTTSEHIDMRGTKTLQCEKPDGHEGTHSAHEIPFEQKRWAW